MTWAAWVAFVVDFAVRLALADGRLRFVRTHVFDLAVIVLPMFRPLRLLRLVTLIGFLQRRAAPALRGRVAVYVAGSTTLLVFVSALAVLDAERQADQPNITGFGDALWWAGTTVTTVGYGDRFPTTGEGRLIAVALMLAGIALLGIVTATLATWFVEMVQVANATTTSEVEQLSAEVASLRTQLAAAQPAAGVVPSG